MLDIKIIVIFIIVFLVLDLLWIRYFGKIFGPMITNIQGHSMQLNYIGAISAYLIMIIAYLVIGFENNKPLYLNAMMLGLAIYGTYEFTNYATLSKWNNKLVITLDILWGVTVSILSLFITDTIYNLIK